MQSRVDKIKSFYSDQTPLTPEDDAYRILLEHIIALIQEDTAESEIRDSIIEWKPEWKKKGYLVSSAYKNALVLAADVEGLQMEARRYLMETQLRNLYHQAVEEEKYELAVKIQDRIAKLTGLYENQTSIKGATIPIMNIIYTDDTKVLENEN